MKRVFIATCSTLLLARLVFSQDIDSTASQLNHSEIRTERVVLVGAGYAAIVTAAHLQNYNSWWRGDREAFHFADDTAKTLGADKLGHLYFTFLGSDLVGHSLVWAGLEPKRAFLYSGALSLAFQLYVEIEDGFHPELGFSFGDAIAGLIGAGYPYLQEIYPPLRGVTFKWNFIRSERFKRGSHRTVIDDYESQYYWLAVNIRDVFPNIVPSFLDIAVGYGVKSLDRPNNGERELYLALDYDFTKLPGEGSFLSTVKHVLNYFHFPSPAIRLTPSVIVYGLRF